MPRAAELQSIVHYGRSNPAIDTGFFPNTQSSWFWSSSPYAYYSSRAWNLHFYYGYVLDSYGKGNPYDYQARLVRGGQ